MTRGDVSPEDLDKTVQDGLGLRWSFIGPFATIELNAPGGVADYCARNRDSLFFTAAEFIRVRIGAMSQSKVIQCATTGSLHVRPELTA